MTTADGHEELSAQVDEIVDNLTDKNIAPRAIVMLAFLILAVTAMAAVSPSNNPGLVVSVGGVFAAAMLIFFGWPGIRVRHSEDARWLGLFVLSVSLIGVATQTLGSFYGCCTAGVMLALALFCLAKRLWK